MIKLHIWKVDISDEFANTFGFSKRDGFYDKIVKSQMSEDYIKIYPGYS